MYVHFVEGGGSGRVVRFRDVSTLGRIDGLDQNPPRMPLPPPAHPPPTPLAFLRLAFLAWSREHAVYEAWEFVDAVCPVSWVEE